MARNEPGKHYRKGITLMEAVQQFDTEEKAEAWFVSQRWPDGVICPFCESTEVSPRPTRKPQPFRCRDCRKDFSVTVGTLLHRSHVPLSKWAIAFYLFATNLKGVSSMKLHRDLGITQKTAWYMAHRIRQMWSEDDTKFAGSVEVDETYIGGKEHNKHADKKLRAGRGAVGKTPVAGVRDRATGRVQTEVVKSTDKGTLQDFVLRHTIASATVYTDEAAVYRGLPRLPRGRQTRRGRVCPGHDGSHQRAGKPLGPVQAWDRRYLSPYLRQAPSPVLYGVRGPTQQQAIGYRRTDGDDGKERCGPAVAVSRADRAEKDTQSEVALRTIL